MALAPSWGRSKSASLAGAVQVGQICRQAGFGNGQQQQQQQQGQQGQQQQVGGVVQPGALFNQGVVQQTGGTLATGAVVAPPVQSPPTTQTPPVVQNFDTQLANSPIFQTMQGTVTEVQRNVSSHTVILATLQTQGEQILAALKGGG